MKKNSCDQIVNNSLVYYILFSYQLKIKRRFYKYVRVPSITVEWERIFYIQCNRIQFKSLQSHRLKLHQSAHIYTTQRDGHHNHVICVQHAY